MATHQRPPVLRFEHPEDPGTEFPSLRDALCELPADPESRICYRGGRRLAEAHKGVTRWVLTAVGQAALELELRGERWVEISDEVSEELAAESEAEWCNSVGWR